MNRGIWGLLLIAIIMTTNADASKWQPYVGAYGTAGMPVVLYGIDYPDQLSCLPIPYSDGAQIELGFVRNSIFCYVGYNYLNSVSASSSKIIYVPEMGQSYTRYEEHYRWKERRILLGVRYGPPSSSKLTPLVGCAVSVGRSINLYEYRESHSFSYLGNVITIRESSQNRQSDISVGLMLECGVAFKLSRFLNASLLGQLHRYESDFGSDANYYTPDHAVVFMPQICLGMQYTFNKLSF